GVSTYSVIHVVSSCIHNRWIDGIDCNRNQISHACAVRTVTDLVPTRAAVGGLIYPAESSGVDRSRGDGVNGKRVHARSQQAAIPSLSTIRRLEHPYSIQGSSIESQWLFGIND